MKAPAFSYLCKSRAPSSHVTAQEAEAVVELDGVHVLRLVVGVLPQVGAGGIAGHPFGLIQLYALDGHTQHHNSSRPAVAAKRIGVHLTSSSASPADTKMAVDAVGESVAVVKMQNGGE